MVGQGREQGLGDLSPVRMHHEGRDDVADEGQPHRQEHPLDEAAVGAQHQDAEHQRRPENGDRQGHAEQAERAADAGELGEHGAAVGDDDHHRGEERPAHPEALPDQVHQPLAGDASQPGHHLLGDDQGEQDREEGPEQVEAVLRPGVAVGEDATGVVSGVGDDQARADDREVAARRRSAVL